MPGTPVALRRGRGGQDEVDGTGCRLHSSAPSSPWSVRGAWVRAPRRPCLLPSTARRADCARTRGCGDETIGDDRRGGDRGRDGRAGLHLHSDRRGSRPHGGGLRPGHDAGGGTCQRRSVRPLPRSGAHHGRGPPACAPTRRTAAAGLPPGPSSRKDAARPHAPASRWRPTRSASRIPSSATRWINP